MKSTFNDFVDLYNSLIDRAKSQGSAVPAAVALSRNACAGPSTEAEPAAPPPVSTPPVRRHGTGAAYLVSGAALKSINGVYSQSGESDGVPKYVYMQYLLLRRTQNSGMRCWFVTDTTKPSETSTCYYCCRSSAGTPPLEVQWERGTNGLLPGTNGLLPGPFLTPISMTHAAPTSVLALLQVPSSGPACLPFPTHPALGVRQLTFTLA